MNQQVVIFSGLASTMLLLGAALAVAWSKFGRRRHAADWAAAFLAMGFAYAVVTVRWWLPGTRVDLSIVASIFCTICSSLLGIGFRRRAGLGGLRAIGVATVLVSLAVTIIELVYPARAYYRLIVNGYAAATAFLALPALRQSEQSPDSARSAARILLLGYALFCAAMTALSAVAAPNGDFPEEIYRLLFLLVAPTGLTGIGLAAMLLIASDLAEDLRRLAAFDPLTGVLNRRGVEAAAARMLPDARRSGSALTLILADLDRFKAINDRFGHALGDAVLRCFAQHCESVVRATDVVGRLGGEEFIILMPNASLLVAMEAMERLRAGLAAALARNDLPTAVTASFGIASFHGRGDTLTEMLERADAALFGSKEDGRDRITFAPTPAALERRVAAVLAHAS